MGNLKEKFRQEVMANLRIEYQPIFEIGSGSLLGYEAMVRGPGRFRSPRALFEQAAKLDLGAEFEIACFRQALRAEVGGLLFVNLSGYLIPDLELLDDARGLVIEITEGPEPDFAKLVRALDAWRERGAKIAVDDVERDVHRLRVKPDYAKVGSRLTRTVLTCEGSRILWELASMAEKAGAVVIAEGIENDEVLKAVSDLGIPYGQGFHLGVSRELFARRRVLAPAGAAGMRG